MKVQSASGYKLSFKTATIFLLAGFAVLVFLYPLSLWLASQPSINDSWGAVPLWGIIVLAVVHAVTSVVLVGLCRRSEGGIAYYLVLGVAIVHLVFSSIGAVAWLLFAWELQL